MRRADCSIQSPPEARPTGPSSPPLLSSACCLLWLLSNHSSQKELPHEPGREWEKQRGKEILFINMPYTITEAPGGCLEKPEEEAMESF